MSSAEERALGPNTKTTLGAVGVFIAGALWIQMSLSGMKEQVIELRVEVRSLGQRMDKLEEHRNGGMAASTFREWVRDLERKNPNLSVPAVQ